jgi:hypothetical protein
MNMKTIVVDLMDHNDPHWLSHEGKMAGRCEEIRAKHRAKYLAERVIVRKPARPETMARLQRAIDRYNKRGIAK